jgi:NAD+ synthase (glutamine-hydrolysing)
MNAALRIAIAQVNLLVGDVSGNAARVIERARTARAQGASLVVFPELTLSGYPPEDLLLRRGFLDRVDRELERIQRELRDIAVLVGCPQRAEGGLYNCALLIEGGGVRAVYRKRHLPNYSVFDEKRYFTPGTEPCVVPFHGLRLGVTLCEDIWQDGPVEETAAAGAELLININASPFHLHRARERFEIVSARARRNHLPVIYANLVGGQDELVFDGASFVVDAQGALTQRLPHFEEAMALIEIVPGTPAVPLPGAIAPLQGEEQSAYQALVLGVRDYLGKNGFPGAVIGLSGGIDSALTLAIAADALGAESVHAVSMPSRYTAAMSVEDARAQADALGVRFDLIPIEPMFNAFLQQLAPVFAGRAVDTTEENLQARCRGMLLMAISNKTGRIVLTTGNKSEMAVGYATLYGDMAGGFAAIKDVPKTLVYRLARYRNDIAAAIPERVFTRPPTAELKPGQTDQDVLPPYEILDAILEMYVEEHRAPDEIVARGFAEKVVYDVIRRVDRNEYKRRQAAPGVRITRRAFGRDWRFPIASGWRPWEREG